MNNSGDAFRQMRGSVEGENSPQGIRPELVELIDVPALQSMMEDFYKLTRIPMSLIDVGGRLIVGAGWQDVCVLFHRRNPESCAHCITSDTVLTQGIPAGDTKLYRCKNGMWDAATPITVDGEHVANLFTGQFFFADEEVDFDFFSGQAKRYGFDENRYLNALRSVPRLGRADVEVGLRFLTKLSEMISSLTIVNMLRSADERALRGALDETMVLAEELATERNILTAIMANTETSLAYLDPAFNFVAVNAAYAKGSGHSAEELIGANHFELFPNEENQAIFDRVRETRDRIEFKAKPFEFVDQPWRGVTYWDWSLSPVIDDRGRLSGFALSLQDVTSTIRQKLFSETLNRINDAIHVELDSKKIVRNLVDEVYQTMPYELVGVMSRSEEGRWGLVSVVGVDPPQPWPVLTDDDLLWGTEALRTGRPLVVTAEEISARHGIAVGLGVQSLLVAPLATPNRSLGVLCCAYLSGPGAFEADDVDFIGKVAASLALALSNASLYEAEHEAQRQLQLQLARTELLNRVAVAVTTGTSLVDVCNGFLDAVSAGMDIRIGAIYAYRPAARMLRLIAARGLSSEDLERYSHIHAGPRSATLVARAAIDGCPVTSLGAELDAKRRDMIRELKIAGDSQSVAIPITTQQGVIGTLSFLFERAEPLGEEEWALLHSLVSILGQGMDNVRLYESEREIANRLQEALLALPDYVGGIDFGRSYRSASESARVGGDFYDIFEIDDERVGVVIGDVAGKGLDAAVLTSLVKNTIRAHAGGKTNSPWRVIELTNEIVYRSTPTEAFVTVFFGILDRASGRLVYSNAGHTAAVVVSPNGQVHSLSATGPLVGAFSESLFGGSEFVLDDGDLLFLYTDGMTEARANGRMYGETRLFDLLARVWDGTPAHVVDDAIADVMEFTGNDLTDDLALLALCRREWRTSAQQQRLAL